MKTRARSDSIEMGERARSARSRQRPCLFSEVAARANGPRTVPVRSASEVRSGQEKSAICAPDNPLRTGTVRGPIQRDVPTGLNRCRRPRRRHLRTGTRIISSVGFANDSARGRAERELRHLSGLRSPFLPRQLIRLRASLRNRCWVAQATRLSCPATRRTKRQRSIEPSGLASSASCSSGFRSAGRQPGRAGRPHHPLFRRALKATFIALSCAAALLLTSALEAQTFTTLHNFTQGDDGGIPSASLILSGNTLYGTAASGGSAGNGTVFAVNTDGTGFTTLYSFSARSTNSSVGYTNSDGAGPQAGLILSGNTLYGTAPFGGSSGFGTVF